MSKAYSQSIEKLVKLADTYLESKKFYEALKILDRVELRDNYTARVKGAICSVELGDFVKGIDTLCELKNKKGYDFFLYLKLSESYISANLHLLARSTLREMEKREKGEKLALVSIYCLILDWIEGNTEYLENQFRNIINLNSKDYPNLASYAIYISRLALYWERQHKKNFIITKKFYVIGDSHSLSLKYVNLSNFDGIYTPEIFWIMGAKAYHFGAKENNLMKSKALEIKKVIPENSNILFLFGEIDLRADEGLIKHCLKTGESEDVAIKKTITGYLNFIIENFQTTKNKIYIGTVHAPIYHDDESLKKQLHRSETISNWNDYLKEKIKILNLRIFDIYKYSLDKNKFGKREMFIDDNHLFPFVYEEVFKRENFLNKRNDVKINIDGREIDFDKLDSDLQDLVNSYRFAEQELHRLQAMLALTNAAKVYYMQTLKSRLASTKS